MIQYFLSILVLNAFGSPPASISLQDTSTRGAVAVGQQSGIRMELSGPHGTHVWAASEWTLKLENGGLDGLPFSPYLLGQSGYTYGGACVYFEIVRGDETARNVTSNSYLGHPPSVTKADLLAPGNSAELPVVLHGDMVRDLAAHARDDKIDVRFVPVFPTPGPYTVTALLRWKGSTTRSNPVKLDVSDAPSDSKQALEGLKQFAKAGICIDVQGMYTTRPLADLEQVAEFVENQKHTLYGAQLQVGLAQALLRIVQVNADGGKSQRLVTGVTASLDRVKSLLPLQLPNDFGLERKLRRLREDVAIEERKAR